MKYYDLNTLGFYEEDSQGRIEISNEYWQELLHKQSQGGVIQVINNDVFCLFRNEIVKNGEVVENPNYTNIQAQAREKQFLNDFFLTSLGYVRRKAYIQGTGETKDFLSDCFPVLCNAFALGQNIQAIIYDKPSMQDDVSDWTQYQKTIDWTIKNNQQLFLSDCLKQYQKDFFGA